MLKRRFNAGLAANLFFYRDAGGREIDLVLEYADGVVPVELAASTFAPSFASSLDREVDLVAAHHGADVVRLRLCVE